MQKASLEPLERTSRVQTASLEPLERTSRVQTASLEPLDRSSRVQNASISLDRTSRARRLSTFIVTAGRRRMDVDVIRERLEFGRAAGRRRQLQIQLPALVGGVGAVVLGIGSYLALFVMRVEGYIVLPVILVWPGLVLLMLAVFPTQTRVVNALSAFVFVVTAAAASLWTVATAQSMRTYARLRLATQPACSYDYLPTPAFDCAYFLADAFPSVGNQVTFYSVLAHLLVHTGCSTRTARAKLDSLWRHLSAISWTLVLTTIMAAVSGGLRELSVDGSVRAYFLTAGWLEAFALCAVQLVTAALTLNPQFRMHAQAWLAWRGQAMSTAASIATLLGTGTVAEATTAATSAFRAIALSQVDRTWLSRSTAVDGDLLKHTRPAVVGAVDAFISHSWRDDSDAKWEALQRWGQDFRAKEGREPLVWIDRLCISQSSIETSLSCLPVWLAGCNSLVILHGDTYITRIWCVMEIFVFLQMGRTLEELEFVQLRPLAQQLTELDEAEREREQERRTAEAIERFDVRSAESFVQADTERLLNVIEAGFGELDQFNQVARTMLAAASRQRNLPRAQTASPPETPHNFPPGQHRRTRSGYISTSTGTLVAAAGAALFRSSPPPRTRHAGCAVTPLQP